MALANRLTTPPDQAERRRHLNERLRAEWIAGAEEEWRKRTGRSMTADELERHAVVMPTDRPMRHGPACG